MRIGTIALRLADSESGCGRLIPSGWLTNTVVMKLVGTGEGVGVGDGDSVSVGIGVFDAVGRMDITVGVGETLTAITGAIGTASACVIPVAVGCTDAPTQLTPVIRSTNETIKLV